MSAFAMMGYRVIDMRKWPTGSKGNNPASSADLIALHSQAKYVSIPPRFEMRLQPDGKEYPVDVTPNEQQATASAILQMQRAYG
jgi:hypothetical protein